MADDSTDVVNSAATREARDRASGRIGAGFLLAVNALLGWAGHGTDSGVLIEPLPDGPRAFSFATLLDKIGDVVGRGYSWLEAKLGFTPKN